MHFTKVGQSRQCCGAFSQQHDSYSLYKKDGGNLLPIIMQERPPVLASSNEEKAHNPISSVASLRGSFQTQSIEMGFQTGQHRVLESLPKAACLAHPTCLCIQGESSGGQVHYQAPKPQGSGSQCSGLPMGSSNLIVNPGPPHSSCTGGGSTAPD